jgi:heme-degrading monooxygenase HmoA
MRVRLPWKTGSAVCPSAIVSATRTDFDRFRDMPGAALAALRFRRAFPSTPGAIGLSLAMQPLSRRSWSVSAWQSEEDLRRFVRSAEHVAIVREYTRKVHVRSATWSVDRFRLRCAWREAAQRLRDS